ncbi:hypothetical protein AB71193_03204 [Acinetobacter baumannii]|nr:hypothetical protein [Acinetobacter baumannii]KAF0623231.1 hypothetical protein AB71193_03204 [Acinetobacter baumannii]
MDKFEQWYLDTYYKPHGVVPPTNLFKRYEGTYLIDDVYRQNLAWQHQQAKVEELQNRLDGALKETQYALQYVEEDMRGNHEFLQMAMIRTLKALEQVLKGGEA